MSFLRSVWNAISKPAKKFWHEIPPDNNWLDCWLIDWTESGNAWPRYPLANAFSNFCKILVAAVGLFVTAVQIIVIGSGCCLGNRFWRSDAPAMLTVRSN